MHGGKNFLVIFSINSFFLDCLVLFEFSWIILYFDLNLNFSVI